MTPSDVLDCGDLLLWERFTDKESVGDKVVARLRVDIMPDGQPCKAEFVGFKPKDAVRAWHDYVRGQYDARTAEQTAKADGRADAPRAGGEREAEPAAESGGGGAAVEEDHPDREETVEAILESKVLTLGRSVSYLSDEVESSRRALAELERRLASKVSEKQRAIRALKLMKELHRTDEP